MSRSFSIISGAFALRNHGFGDENEPVATLAPIFLPIS